MDDEAQPTRIEARGPLVTFPEAACLGLHTPDGSASATTVALGAANSCEHADEHRGSMRRCCAGRCLSVDDNVPAPLASTL